MDRDRERIRGISMTRYLHNDLVTNNKDIINDTDFEYYTA